LPERSSRKLRRAVRSCSNKAALIQDPDTEQRLPAKVPNKVKPKAKGNNRDKEDRDKA